uniref:Uncharacterized protein n=1 Tax=Ciona savignyi TaxID=51511 RepID=H2ZFR3_CIOSA
MLRIDSALYTIVRCASGLYFVLQGCAQTDVIGRALFSNINQFFVDHYKVYVHSIPWWVVGVQPSADAFRQFNGYTMLLCGLFLVLKQNVKISSLIMSVMGAWSVHAHIKAGDPVYTTVCGAIISVLMLLMFLAKKDKTD